MEYPPKLLEKINQRAAGFKLEGCVPGQGKIHPSLMIVGEAPGRNEVEKHVPFCGQSGHKLMESLASTGLKRDDVYITSVVRGRPYSVKKVKYKKTGVTEVKKPNRTPTKKEVLAYAPLFDWELQHVDPQVIVTVGNTSLQRILGPQYNVGKDHGKVFHQPIQELNATGDGYQLTKRKYIVIPTFHPASVFYNPTLAPKIKHDWELISNIIHHEKLDEGTNSYTQQNNTQ